MTKHSNFIPDDLSKFSETQTHIFTAGRELLLAGIGAMKFCKSYLEQANVEKVYPNLMNFFSRAINVASDLGGSMMKQIPILQTSWKLTKPICEKIEKEMREEEFECAPKRASVVKKKVKKIKRKR